jgi:hypothetical protein
MARAAVKTKKTVRKKHILQRKTKTHAAIKKAQRPLRNNT